MVGAYSERCFYMLDISDPRNKNKHSFVFTTISVSAALMLNKFLDFIIYAVFVEGILCLIVKFFSVEQNSKMWVRFVG